MATIAAIRTLLNYFLQQEIDRAARRQPDMALQAHTPPVGEREVLKNGESRNTDHAFH